MCSTALAVDVYELAGNMAVDFKCSAKAQKTGRSYTSKGIKHELGCK